MAVILSILWCYFEASLASYLVTININNKMAPNIIRSKETDSGDAKYMLRRASL